MANLNENLIPYNSDHSISEVIINFHLASKIEDPESFLKTFKANFPDFTDTGLTFSQGIQIKMEKDFKANIHSDQSKIQGFFAKKLIDNKLEIVIQTQNVNPTGIYLLSFHFLAYKRWDTYLKVVLPLINGVASIDNLFIKSIGLAYVDLFDWKSKDMLPLEQIFSKDTHYLGQHFFSYNGDFEVSCAGIVSKENQNEYIERYSIAARKTNSETTRLEIIHNVVLDLKDIKLLQHLTEKNNSTTALEDILDHEHVLNKKFIMDILSAQTKEIIHLS